MSDQRLLQVLALLRKLRDEGFACAHLSVGEVTISGIVDTKLAGGATDVSVTKPASSAADLYRQYGGKAYADLMAAADEERGE